MRCGNGSEPADDRDATVINGIFSAGLILHTHLNQIDNGKAACYVEGALEQLDDALREIRWAAFVRHRRDAHS
jgi:hypothetical protein